MANVQVRKTESKADWERTFPSEIHIERNSGIFAFRLIKITTAFILDKRSLLREESFKTRNIEKLLVATFNKENPVALRLDEKIEQLKQAILNRYLREFALVFYKSPNEEDIIEVYTFRLVYTAEGDVSLTLDTGLGSQQQNQNLLEAKFESLEQTKALFINTMKKLHRCMKGLDDLPEDADASFRIAFTDNAPEDYMPNGFDESDQFYKIDSTTNMELGTICGGHHKIQLLAASHLIKQGRAAVDLNQTSVSMNQSILNTPTTKRKVSEGPKKRRSSNRARPYGQTEAMTTVRRKPNPT